MISEICETSKLAESLFEKYCPGPLTLILKKSNGVDFPELLTGDLPTLGVRFPNCKVTQAISALVPFPYTTPSANKSGDTTPYSVNQVVESLEIENVDLILDAGTLTEKLPSTIVNLSEEPFRIVREGEITSKKIQAIIGSSYSKLKTK